MSSITQETPDDAALGGYIDAAAPMLGLIVAADWRPDVLLHLKAITAAARLVQAYPLDDALEPAPVYRA
ncbi:DUF4089 domain-containing protein [Beijerinckia sp. L45]|uniref:DUF4089 domain-containing protein n=1 Tax=Beijerinckia sp. L45 TaxID=1641855 RepID=UPI001FF02723|nr:DUF4089 domain-containing protein [Beijerinckia sp. L45]